MTMIYPGPTEIRPGVLPGGVVVHVYEVPSRRRLCVSYVKHLTQAQAAAERAAAVARGLVSARATGLCLVAFDGDTGRRFTADEWGQQ